MRYGSHVRIEQMVVTLLADERTDAVVLHKKARSYLRSAHYLKASNPSISYSHAGVTFLFCHAIELFLLAYLRGQGGDISELNKSNCRVAATTSKAIELGLKLHPEALGTLTQLADTVIALEVRYILTGVKQIPTIDPLSNAAQNLDVAVSKALVALGLP